MRFVHTPITGPSTAVFLDEDGTVSCDSSRSWLSLHTWMSTLAEGTIKDKTDTIVPKSWQDPPGFITYILHNCRTKEMCCNTLIPYFRANICALLKPAVVNTCNVLVPDACDTSQQVKFRSIVCEIFHLWRLMKGRPGADILKRVAHMMEGLYFLRRSTTPTYKFEMMQYLDRNGADLLQIRSIRDLMRKMAKSMILTSTVPEHKATAEAMLTRCMELPYITEYVKSALDCTNKDKAAEVVFKYSHEIEGSAPPDLQERAIRFLKSIVTGVSFNPIQKMKAESVLEKTSGVWAEFQQLKIFSLDYFGLKDLVVDEVPSVPLAPLVDTIIKKIDETVDDTRCEFLVHELLDLLEAKWSDAADKRDAAWRIWLRATLRSYHEYISDPAYEVKVKKVLSQIIV